MKYFIGKVKDTNVKGINESDVVYYIEFEGFECFHLKGACFSGFEKEFKQLFDEGKIESILTTQDIEKLYDIDNKLAKLGFGIEKDSDRYKHGDMPYFDDKAFGKDLLESGDYIELKDGRIVHLSY